MQNYSKNPVLQCQSLTVQRGDFALCESVSLQLYCGDICHLVGEKHCFARRSVAKWKTAHGSTSSPRTET
ncbi:hypothetical protein ACGTJS_04115 [Faucicola mancuniensis]|uniref:hypothetical protein n=1 Tax=Faucicola mancuniensis TaxID=1309795 RepID=UPI003977A391